MDPRRDPPDRVYPEEEPVTKPDIGRFICPQCKGEGQVTEETWVNGHLHRSLIQTCDLCMGDKWVDRASREKYRARKGL